MESVYIDLYFLVNVSMDFLCITVTAALMHRSIKRWRALVAALLGGGYAVTILLVGVWGVIGFFTDALAALGLCAVVFWRRGERFLALVRSALILWLTSGVLGGLMTALYALLNRLELPLEALEGDGLSAWTFALVSAVAGLLTAKGGRLFGRARRAKTATVHVRLYGKEVELRAMVDTGNLLSDPISGRSVMLAELNALQEVLPVALWRACQNGRYADWLDSAAHATGTRLIPTRSAEGEGLLLAVVPEQVRVSMGRETYTANYLLAPKQLGLADFEAILPEG